MLARLHYAMRLGSLAKLQSFINRGAQAAVLKLFTEACEKNSDDLGLLRFRAGAQRRSEYLQMTPQHSCQIDFTLRALHETDQHEASAMA